MIWGVLFSPINAVLKRRKRRRSSRKKINGITPVYQNYDVKRPNAIEKRNVPVAEVNKAQQGPKEIKDLQE